MVSFVIHTPKYSALTVYGVRNTNHNVNFEHQPIGSKHNVARICSVIKLHNDLE